MCGDWIGGVSAALNNVAAKNSFLRGTKGNQVAPRK